MKIVVLTAIAMLAFAANSVLARLAFATANAEPLSYTGIRLAAGAIVLAALLLLRRSPGAPVAVGGAAVVDEEVEESFELQPVTSAANTDAAKTTGAMPRRPTRSRRVRVRVVKSLI